MMKTLKKLLLVLLAVLMACSCLVGCRDEETDPGQVIPTDADPAKTIKVERLRCGYGDEWLNELKVKFEAAFPGYYVELKPSTSDMRGDTVVRQLYRGYAKNGNIDLFVTGDITDEMIDSTNSYTVGSPLVTDITDGVYNQKAIGYDGQEEELTVSEKLRPSMHRYIKNYRENAYYGLPIINSTSGLTVNTVNLAKFGYTELPRTTNELVEMATNIYLGKKADGSDYEEGPSTKSFMFPFTYCTGAQYSGLIAEIMIAQKDAEFFTTLQSFVKPDGTRMLHDGYELYKDPIFQYPTEVAYFMHDPKISARGSTTATLDEVQAKMVASTRDRAVFMVNGDWVLNEVNKNFPTANEVLDFINFPLSSEVGVEVFSDKSAEEADKLLSYVVKLVDQNKTIEEIIADVATNKGYTLTTAQAERIAKARGIYELRGIEHRCFVPHDSPKKDIVYKFLRMMASEDCAGTIARCAAQSSAFATRENDYTDIPFVKNASKISVNRYATEINWTSSGLRHQMSKGAFFYTQGEYLNKFWAEDNTSMFANGQLNGSSWADVYGKNATARLEAVYTLFKDNWEATLAEKGITE